MTAYTEMNLSDKVPTPFCSRCKEPDAEYRINLRPVCRECIRWIEKIRLFNRDMFA